MQNNENRAETFYAAATGQAVHLSVFKAHLSYNVRIFSNV